MNTVRYNSFGAYAEKKYGTKVYKLALDGGMTCPNRDGSLGEGGCIFCSEGGSGDFAERLCGDIGEQIDRAKRRIDSKVRGGKYIAYFQNYTNTYAPTSYLEPLFTSAINHRDVVALSIGTRPDCLPSGVLDLLDNLNRIKPVTVELGLQTMHKSTAKLIRRGYELKVYDEAVCALKARNIEVVTHVILGLPHETRDMMLETVKHVGDIGSDGIKLQLLHVLGNTELEHMYNRGEFECMTEDEYIDLLCDCIKILPPNIVIHRLTGDAPKRLLVAPKWSANKKHVLNSITRTLEIRDVIQGKRK